MITTSAKVLLSIGLLSASTLAMYGVAETPACTSDPHVVVTAAFRSILQRQPTAEELKTYSLYLVANNSTRKVMIRLVKTPEWKQKHGPDAQTELAALYQEFVNRPRDIPGSNGFIGEIQRQGIDGVMDSNFPWSKEANTFGQSVPGTEIAWCDATAKQGIQPQSPGTQAQPKPDATQPCPPGIYNAACNLQRAKAATPQPKPSAAASTPPPAPTSIIPVAAGDCDPQNPTHVPAAEAIVHARAYNAAKNYHVAACWVYIAAIQGDSAGERAYSEMLEKGVHVLKDDQASARWAEKAKADGLVPKAAGDCDPRSPTKGPGGEAFKSFDAANNKDPVKACWAYVDAMAGDATAEYVYSVMLSFGNHVTRDPAVSILWLRKAADKGYLDAEETLANDYVNGNGIKEDKAAALVWYTKAAEAGQHFAQYNLALVYFQGQGTPVNIPEAHRWILKSAEGGNSHAEWLLYLGYLRGEAGYTPDPARAKYWREKLEKIPEVAARLRTVDEQIKSDTERVAAEKRAKAHGRTLDDQLYVEWLAKLPPEEVARQRQLYFEQNCFKKTYTPPSRNVDGSYDTTIGETHTSFIDSDECQAMQKEVRNTDLPWTFGSFPGYAAENLMNVLFK